MTPTLTLVMCLLAMFDNGAVAQQKIKNALADPQIVYQDVSQTKRACKLEGPPLDIMFVVDGSGSVRESFKPQADMVKSVLSNLAVGGNFVRASLLQYSTNVYTRFKFNTFTNRQDMLDEIDRVEPSGSLTNTGKALTAAINEWSEESGMRADRLNVARILFLLSDGRSRDYPLDVQMAKTLRDTKKIQIYAFGVGTYIDWPILREVATGSKFDGYDRVVNSDNATKAMDWFAPYKGTEVCEEVPVCIPGSGKPMDLLFILDTSTSVNNDWGESLSFVRRALNNVNVDPMATRVAVMTFSSTARKAFDFNNPRARNNTGVLALLNEIQPYEGVTNTVDALKMAGQIFDDATPRNFSGLIEAKRLAIILTDGYSSQNPEVYSRRLVELKKVDVFAVALNLASTPVNRDGLNDLVVSRSERIFPVTNRVFIAQENLIKFEDALLNYTDKNCPGMTSTAGTKQVELSPIETVCSSSGMRLLLRTKEDFDGLLYTVGFDNEAGCTITGSGTKEVRMVIGEGSCGMTTTGSGASYKYKVNIGMRFHSMVDTAADDSITVECKVDGTPKSAATPVSNDVASLTSKFIPSRVKCHYKVTPLTGQRCELLDAEVGAVVNHEWDCAGLTPDQFIFVHNCVADSDADNTTQLSLITEQGCEVDKYLITAPTYDVKKSNDRVSVQSYMFKFPTETIVRFRCLISVCDTNQVGNCEYTFNQAGVKAQSSSQDTPSACLNHPNTPKVLRPNQLPNYKDPVTLPGFHATIGVVARRINVFQKPNLATQDVVRNDQRFCSSLRG